MEPADSVFTLNKYWQVVKRRWIPGLGVFVPVCVVSVLASSWKKPAYEAVGKLLFRNPNTLSSSGLGQESDDVKIGTPEDHVNILSTEAQIIYSTLIVQKTIDNLQLKDNHNKPLSYQGFLERLTVKEIQDTSVLKVAYWDRDPELAAKVVNTLMNTYLEYKISVRKTQALLNREFIEKQLPKEELLIRQAETKLADFKEKNKIVSLPEEAAKSVEMIADLQKKMVEIKAQMANVGAQAKQVRVQLGMNNQQAVTFNSLSQVEGVQSLVAEIQQLESQLAQQRTVFQDTYPEINSLESKINALKTILRDRVQKVSNSERVNLNDSVPSGEQQQWAIKLVELESMRLGLASELATLSTLDRSYRLRYNKMPELEKQQRQLERQVNAAQSTYLHWLKKLQDARIAENQAVSNASVISTATVPEEPIDARKDYYLSAVFLSGLVAILTMCILEARDKTIKTVDEAKDLLELPLLGVIPLWGKSKKLSGKQEDGELSLPLLVMRDAPASPMSEAYRMLRANLKFVSANRQLKVIVVTSAVPREGKSSVAANLAYAMTQGEHSVLLIDGDLHRPSQSQAWNLSNQHGLSEVILGEVEVMKAIKKVSSYLDVLTSGAIPPSPAFILDSKRMGALVDSFAAYYDYVVIDAPALNLAVDAATLGQMADGVLLVVRPGIIDYKNAIATSDLLRKSGLNVVGQVVNGVPAENANLSKYYFQEEYTPQDRVYHDDAKQTI